MMDKNSFMHVIISTLQGEIYNHERIRDNHAENKDQKNVDYLNERISKYEAAIEILKESETSKKPALNIADVSDSEPVNCLKEFNEEICDECEFVKTIEVGHPGGSSYHSAEKRSCEWGHWEDDF